MTKWIRRWTRRRRAAAALADIGPATVYTSRAGAYPPGGCDDRTQLHTGIAPLLTPLQRRRAAGGDWR
ncbi:hypothetical protein AB0B88_15980 [Micromonospora haikouensis]|uniref:hypothetical protein n=1 Tax=Micromonospora haikouensis TaxID=686309 RepID=UPI0033C31C73